MATYEELESGPVASVQIVKQYYDREVVFGKCYGTNTNTMMNGGTREMIFSLTSKDTGVPKNPGLFLNKQRIFLKHTPKPLPVCIILKNGQFGHPCNSVI